MVQYAFNEKKINRPSTGKKKRDRKMRLGDKAWDLK